MYSWFFRRVLPGPVWLRVLECIFLLYLIIFALFNWGYPWLNDYLDLNQNTVATMGVTASLLS